MHYGIRSESSAQTSSANETTLKPNVGRLPLLPGVLTLSDILLPTSLTQPGFSSIALIFARNVSQGDSTVCDSIVADFRSAVLL